MCPRAARCGWIRWSRCARSRAQGSWKEPASRPAAGCSCVQQAFVKTSRAAVPELDRIRHETKAAPEGRSRYRSSREALLGVANASLQQLARGEPLTLL